MILFRTRQKKFQKRSFLVSLNFDEGGWVVALMWRSAWSTTWLFCRAPRGSGCTGSRCCPPEDQLKTRNRNSLSLSSTTRQVIHSALACSDTTQSEETQKERNILSGSWLMLISDKAQVNDLGLSVLPALLSYSIYTLWVELKYKTTCGRITKFRHLNPCS